MASSYMGEDELDYEDEDYTQRSTPHAAHDDMEEEEDYDDLYSDVNVGFFPNSAGAALKNEWEKASRGFEAHDQQLGRLGGVFEQGSGSTEPAAQGQLQVGSHYGLQNQDQEGRGDGLVAAEARLNKSDAVTEIMVEDQREGKVQDLDYGKSTRSEALSSSLTVMGEETSSKLVEGRGLRNAVAHLTDRLAGGSSSMINEEQHTVVPQQTAEIFASPPKFTSPKDRIGSSTEEVPVETGASGAVGPGTNVPGPSSLLEDRAVKLSAGAGVSKGGADEGTRGEGMISPWDGGGSGRTGAALRPTAAVASGVNRASPANTTHYYPGRGSSQSGDGGNTRLFIGELHWWTTDAELEAALSEYGRVKNLKFFEERASGKSKGYCQVEFYDSSAARACKEGMDGRNFNGRPCVITFASSYTFRQMSAAHVSKTQAPPTFTQGRKTTVDGGGIKSGSTTSQGGKMGMGGRGHGPGSGRTGQGTSFRGRGGMGTRNMASSAAGGGGVPPYGQGNQGTLAGPPMPPQGMMGQGYDPTYGPAMGRGGSVYGGYVPRGPTYAGMGIPYPTVGPVGLPGVAPHVNPAFFGRGASMNGMGMLAGSSMEGAGGWGDASLSGWGGEEHDQRIRESSYGEESGGVDYSYGGDTGHERGRVGVARDRDKGRDGEWGPYGERRRREDRDGDWEREKVRERGKDRDWEEEDYERERHARTRNKPRATDDDEQRSRSREEDFGKRRRMVR